MQLCVSLQQSGFGQFETSSSLRETKAGCLSKHVSGQNIVGLQKSYEDHLAVRL